MSAGGRDAALVAHAARVLGEHQRRCRENGLAMPLELEGLLLLLASGGQTWPAVAAATSAADCAAMSFETVAGRLQVSSRTVRRLVAAGELPAVAVGGCRRVLAADFDLFVASRRPAGAA